MKKRIVNLFKFLGVVFLLLLVGCSNSADNDEKKMDEENLSKTVWEKSENGYLEKVVFGNASKDGLSEKIIWYSIEENATGKGLAFMISKLESNNNVIYKGSIIAKQKNEAFSQDYWTHYKISCGQNTISMANVVHGADEENGDYEFIIVGGISESQLDALKNANVLKISLENQNNSERNTAFACDYNFILNLIKYF